MSQNKTRPTQQSVAEFIATIEDEQKRADCLELKALMQKLTGEPAKMWGPGIVGFGNYHYRYASGREGDFFETGFSPRKQALTVYLISGFDAHAGLTARLGKFKTGKSCLYVKRLDDIDRSVLSQLLAESVAYIRDKYPAN